MPRSTSSLQVWMMSGVSTCGWSLTYEGLVYHVPSLLTCLHKEFIFLWMSLNWNPHGRVLRFLHSSKTTCKWWFLYCCVLFANNEYTFVESISTSTCMRWNLRSHARNSRLVPFHLILVENIQTKSFSWTEPSTCQAETLTIIHLYYKSTTCF